jgi:hypothetical protein
MSGALKNMTVEELNDQEVCPSGAYDNGSFRKMDCLTHTMRHGIYPLALKDEIGCKNIEAIINTANDT